MAGESENVVDQAAITQLLYRYALALDKLDAQAFAETLLPELATPELLEKVMRFHRKFKRTMHNVLNHVHVIENDVAKGTTYCVVTYVAENNGTVTKFDTYSEYRDEEFLKRDGRWIIAKRKWTPLYSTPATPVVEGVPAGFWDGMG